MTYETFECRNGKLILTENGGGMSKTGEAEVICDTNGNPKTPFDVPTSGQLSNAVHAYFFGEIGDMIVHGSYNRFGWNYKIWEVTDTWQLNDYEIRVELVCLHSFENGEWDSKPDASLQPAIDAVTAKASDYHCRQAYFIA